MDLYLIRHAQALALGERGITEDDGRPLSDDGEIQARQLGTTFVKRGFRLERVLTSPLLRARRTAELMLENWPAPAPELQELEELRPGVKPRRLARALRDLRCDHIALVGHQPDLGKLAGWFLGAKKVGIPLAKGGVAHISWESELRKGGASLVWLITPQWYEES